MSYQIYLVQKKGADALASARALSENASDEINPGPVVPEKEARKKRIADALLAVNSKLEPFNFDFAEIAEFHGISEEESRVRYRHVELDGPANGNGIQITLHDNSACVTVPYWHADNGAARAVFAEIWRYLRIFRRFGCAAYDPQLDRILDLARDREAALATYVALTLHMPEIAREKISSEKQAKKPWWKFW
jgi:hypothetical protein